MVQEGDLPPGCLVSESLESIDGYYADILHKGINNKIIHLATTDGEQCGSITLFIFDNEDDVKNAVTRLFTGDQVVCAYDNTCIAGSFSSIDDSNKYLIVYVQNCKIRAMAHSDSGVRRTPIPGHAAQ